MYHMENSTLEFSINYVNDVSFGDKIETKKNNVGQIGRKKKVMAKIET